MANITNIEQFRSYVKTALGDPVICIEVANTQIDQIIEDSIQEFQRYMFSEGAYEHFLIFQVSAGVSEYTVSGVQDIVSLNYDNIFDVNVLHSDMNMLWYGGGFNTNNFLGNSGQMILTSYEIMNQYIEEVKHMFGKTYRVQYRESANKLHLLPTPSNNGTGVLRCYKKEDAVNLYNNVLVKKLVVARVMKQWGFNLGKYTIDMPGGGQVNGNDIYSKGETQETKVLEDIRMESEPIDPIIA